MPVESFDIVKIQPKVEYVDCWNSKCFIVYKCAVWYKAKVTRPPHYVGGDYWYEFYWRITYCPYGTGSDVECPNTSFDDDTWNVHENDGTQVFKVTGSSCQRKVYRNRLKKVWFEVKPQSIDELKHVVYFEEQNGTILKVLFDGEVVAENVPNGSVIDVQKATILISTTPSGVKVYIDEEYKGET